MTPIYNSDQGFLVWTCRSILKNLLRLCKSRLLVLNKSVEKLMRIEENPFLSVVLSYFFIGSDERQMFERLHKKYEAHHIEESWSHCR